MPAKKTDYKRYDFADSDEDSEKRWYGCCKY